MRFTAAAGEGGRRVSSASSFVSICWRLQSSKKVPVCTDGAYTVEERVGI